VCIVRIKWSKGWVGRERQRRPLVIKGELSRVKAKLRKSG